MFKYSLQYIVIIFLLGGFLGVAKQTHAQDFQLYSAEDVFIETIPAVPGPNEQVTLKLDSYSFNVNNYYIGWFKDGQQQSAGYGQREFKFKTGNSGDITNITAVIEFEGQVFRKELLFAPSQVDLLWEAVDAYTPPFYKGKALALQQSNIRVTAIPETLLIEPNDAPNLVYYWDRNYKRDGGGSGFGRQSLSFTSDPLVVEEKITVTSNDRRENSVATNTITIPTKKTNPKLLFYEINEEGRLMTHRALNNNGLIDGDTVRFSFHPLHMSTVQPNFTDLFVDWSINNQHQAPQDFAKQNELYITSGGQSGTIAVDVTLEGIQKLLQKVNERFELVFNVN